MEFSYSPRHELNESAWNNFGRQEYLDEVCRIEDYINRLSDRKQQQTEAVRMTNLMNAYWPHHGEQLSIIGETYSAVVDPATEERNIKVDSMASGASYGFDFWRNEDNVVEYGLLLETTVVDYRDFFRKQQTRLFSFTPLRPGVTVTYETDNIDPFDIYEGRVAIEDPNFSFGRYARLFERYMHKLGRDLRPNERELVLEYVRQRWPYGGIQDAALSANYGYQVDDAGHPVLMRFPASRQPIRGSVEDFGLFPIRLSSDSTLRRKAETTGGYSRDVYFGADRLALLFQPDDPRNHGLAEDRLLIVPFNQESLGLVVTDNSRRRLIQ